MTVCSQEFCQRTMDETIKFSIGCRVLAGKNDRIRKVISMFHYSSPCPSAYGVSFRKAFNNRSPGREVAKRNRRPNPTVGSHHRKSHLQKKRFIERHIFGGAPGFGIFEEMQTRQHHEACPITAAGG